MQRHAYNIKTTNLSWCMKVNVVKVRFWHSIKILVHLHNKGSYGSNKLNITMPIPAIIIMVVLPYNIRVQNWLMKVNG